MANNDPSDSESEEKSSSEELETPTNGSSQVVSEYEKERLARIRENKARMEALGLHKMASTLMGSVEKQSKRKGKAKVVEEDEEYRPPHGAEDGLSSSSGEDGDDDDGEEEEFVGGGGSRSRARKVKNKNSKPKKKVSIKKLLSTSDFIDDDEALMQAIALSLTDSTGVSDMVHSGPSQSSDAQVVDASLNERKGNGHIQEDKGRRKRKKSVCPGVGLMFFYIKGWLLLYFVLLIVLSILVVCFTIYGQQISSRVQMSEDELIIHFFQFDAAGKGAITLRDLQRVANTHDFTWTDKEMADMIHCFDSNRDGKLSLDDFREIVVRCNMIQRSENALMGSKP